MNYFYVIVLGLPVILAPIYSRLSDSNRRKAHWLSTILLAILVSHRDNVGADLKTYQAYYSFFLHDSSPNISFNDIGYNLLNKFCGDLGISFTFFLFLISIFSIHSFYRYLEEQDFDEEYIPTALYFLIFEIFIYSLSAIRQSISIACLLYSVVYLKRGKKVSALFFYILGILFHWSLAFVLPIYFVSLKFRQIKVRWLIFFIPLSTIVYYLFMQSNLLQRFAGINYNLTLYLIYERNTVSYGGHWIMYSMLAVGWIIFRGLVISNEDGKVECADLKENLFSMEIDDWMIYLFFVSKVWLAIFYNSALPRFQMYMYFFLPFVFGKLMSKFGGNITRIIVSLVLTIILIVSFYASVNENYIHYGNATFDFIH